MTTLVLATVPPSEVRLTPSQVAAAAGLSPAHLARLVRLGLIEPCAPGASDFTVEATVRLRRMCRLRRDLGVSFVSAAIIVDLVDRVDRLQAELAHARVTQRTSNEDTL